MNLEVQDHERLAVLGYAVEVGTEKTVDLLLGLGASTEAKDLLGRTALRWAGENGNAGMLQLLTYKSPRKEAERR